MSTEYFPNADLSYLPIYDQELIHDAFNWIAQYSQIEFNFPQGGCQQRAQIMSMFLDKRFNLNHCKVWLFPPISLYPGDTRTLYIKDKNEIIPGNCIEWNYHVAPVLRMREGNIIKTMVIDPSINFREPILLEKWFDEIGNSSVSKYTFLLPDKYFFYCLYTSNNILTSIFDGTFFNYEKSIKDDLVVEKGLALNDAAIGIFKKHLKGLLSFAREHDKIKLKDLKDIFGNATVMDLLISQNISGYSENTTHRYAMKNYSDLIEEARLIFSKRLKYWTSVTNELLSV